MLCICSSYLFIVLNMQFFFLPLGGIKRSSSFVDPKGGLAVFSVHLPHPRAAGSHGIVKPGRSGSTPVWPPTGCVTVCLSFLTCGYRAQEYGMSMAKMDSDPDMVCPWLSWAQTQVFQLLRLVPPPVRSGHTPLPAPSPGPSPGQEWPHPFTDLCPVAVIGTQVEGRSVKLEMGGLLW